MEEWKGDFDLVSSAYDARWLLRMHVFNCGTRFCPICRILHLTAAIVSGLFSLPSIAGGELFERIVDDNFEHTEPTSARYMQQILEGMQYVHKQNIVHLDLKPENIVCVDTTGTRIKIIDFGLASELGELAQICRKGLKS